MYNRKLFLKPQRDEEEHAIFYIRKGEAWGKIRQMQAELEL